MKQLLTFIFCLQIVLPATCQTNLITLIPPGIETTIPAADHWRYTMPRTTMLSIAENLTRANGCIADYKLQRQIIDSLQAALQKYQIAATLTSTATEALQQVERLTVKITKAQKVRAWFQARWKDLTAFILGLIAALEAAYIVYNSIK
jgi:hypothetical protein